MISAYIHHCKEQCRTCRWKHHDGFARFHDGSKWGYRLIRAIYCLGHGNPTAVPTDKNVHCTLYEKDPDPNNHVVGEGWLV